MLWKSDKFIFVNVPPDQNGKRVWDCFSGSVCVYTTKMEDVGCTFSVQFRQTFSVAANRNGDCREASRQFPSKANRRNMTINLSSLAPANLQ